MESCNVFTAFTSSLDTDGCLLFCHEKFTDIYEAAVYAYKKSHEYMPNTTKSSYYMVKYRTIICKHNRFPDYTFEEFIDPDRPTTTRYAIVKHVKIRCAEIIQRQFRAYLKRKLDAVVFLQYHLRKAIANPYTRLCRRRLLREFNEM
jgi:hypothetical protein